MGVVGGNLLVLHHLTLAFFLHDGILVVFDYFYYYVAYQTTTCT